MAVFDRLKTLLSRQGPWTAAVKLYVLTVDRLFDVVYGLETCAWSDPLELTVTGGNKERGNSYQPTRVVPLRKLLKATCPLFPADSVLLDLGCGKGRVLFVAAPFGFKAVKGVEFAHELCTIARKNIASFQAKSKARPEFHIVEADVTDYPIGKEENVFFMFNPFDETILEKVLCNISTSLQAHPRPIWIIYHHPKCREAIEKRSHFSHLKDLSFWGYNFTIYSNSVS
ncbi:MAG: hypothetical protein JWQ71_2742 [Pedosphaera sp.]|nr:hypothetical protein [Pedosphaera sp.]